MNFIKNVLTDLKVELMDEFDRNFERKAFFTNPWPATLTANRRGSLMMRSGALRRGNRAQVVSGSIVFSNSLPYASIHNQGGAVTITRKMQKFFWAMYYSLTSKVTYNIKTKSAVYNQKTKRLTKEAMYWRSLALKKVGSKLNIPERRFIGPHPQVDAAVNRVVDDNFRELDTYMKSILKR